MTEEQIAGLILIILGGFQAVRPDLMLRFQIWTQRIIMGATYTPSDRTVKIVRILGAIIMVLGLLLITSILK